MPAERAPALRGLLLAALGFGLLALGFVATALRGGAFRRIAGKGEHAQAPDAAVAATDVRGKAGEHYLEEDHLFEELEVDVGADRDARLAIGAMEATGGTALWRVSFRAAALRRAGLLRPRHVGFHLNGQDLVAADAAGTTAGRVLFVSGETLTLVERESASATSASAEASRENDSDTGTPDADGKEGRRGGRHAASILRKEASPGRIVQHYLSPDTAPIGFAVARSSWAAPFFLVSLVALCAALVPALPTLTVWYADVLSAVALVPERDLLQEGASLSFRPFFALVILLLSLFAAGSPVARIKLLGFSLSLYVTTVLALDLVLARAGGSWVPGPFEPVGGIAAAFAGLLAIIVSVFSRYNLPEGVRVVRRVRSSPTVLLVLLSCVAAALTVTTLFSYFHRRYFDDVHLRLIGGLDSELVILLLSIVGLLFLASALNHRAKPTDGPGLSVGFLVPAFNEAHCIADTIRAIDAAAARYAGSCTLYVVDNGSQDRTPEVSARALASCVFLDGVVLACPMPGKSRALNFALTFASEDVVVRIDADTLVSPSLLEKVVPWFWDASVGGVSGLPLPKVTTPRWLYPLRIIEVYYGAAFLRVAQVAVDGVMVMPGLIAAYRRETLEELGGFAEGINGEDADITMRIGRLGYRIVTDPNVEVYTEVPENLAHLREQRQRWARGLFHMAARNMSTIWMRQGPRGIWILPWSLFNASRRSMMIPVLLCALAVEVLDPGILALREVSVVAGFIVGLQLIVISALLLVHRKFGVILFVPAYLLFRLFRSYVAFETLLTLPLRSSASEDRAARHLRRTLRRARRTLPVREANRTPEAA